MPHILVRDVDAAIYSRLVHQASRQGKSLQQYLLEELTHLARRPNRHDMLERIERRRGIDLDLPEMVAGLRAGRESR
jgi:hypothetical protein